MRKVIAIVASLAAAAALTVVMLPSAGAASSRFDAVRSAMNKYHSIAKAEKHHYGMLLDLDKIACIDMPGMGGMGVHWAKPALVGDPAIEKKHPEALVYAPASDGTLELAAVEYVVIRKDWLATHTERPSLFGHKFNFTKAGNRFGLPAYYSLHVWIWKHNPAGTFAMWNPTVHCP
jgi:hypothetical protein